MSLGEAAVPAGDVLGAYLTLFTTFFLPAGEVWESDASFVLPIHFPFPAYGKIN